MTAQHFRLASAGFSGGELYERARPGYPAEAVAHLLAQCGVVPATRVLDLAAGTGKLTRDLLATGADVLAVEPVAGMRARLAAVLPDAQILEATAERLTVRDGSVDVVTVGQAFHWFDGPSAVREIHRVLVPGGALGLIWNVMDRRVPWVERLQELVHRHRGPSPWYSGHAWRVAFTPDCGFGALQHRAYANTQHVDVVGLVDRVASISFIATLPDAVRTAVADEVRRIAAEELPGQRRFVLPYVTDVFWTRRTLSSGQ